MATTNVQSPEARLAAAERRADESNRRANQMAPHRQNYGSAGLGRPAPSQPAAEGDLDAMAIEALNHRADAYTNRFVRSAKIRLDEEMKNADQGAKDKRYADFDKRCDQVRQEMRDKAMAVYKDAIARRGAHQAALDQLQGAVGLSADPAQRQTEVEARIDDGHDALLAQSGSGKALPVGGPPVTDMESLLLRPDERTGDRSRAENNPLVQEGHGQNIARQVEAAEDMKQQPNFGSVSPETKARQEDARKRREGIASDVK